MFSFNKQKILITLSLLVKTIFSNKKCPNLADSLLKLPNYKSDYFPCAYSGYIENLSKNIFYMYFKQNLDAKDTPLVINLGSGPGVSSLIGLFIENGPFIINKENNIENIYYRKDSLLNTSDLLYIDQPVGTGFSFINKNNNGKFCKTEKEVSEDLYRFIKGFINLHPESLNRKWFFSGSDYALKYALNIIEYLRNKPEIVYYFIFL